MSVGDTSFVTPKFLPPVNTPMFFLNWELEGPAAGLPTHFTRVTITRPCASFSMPAAAQSIKSIGFYLNSRVNVPRLREENQQHAYVLCPDAVETYPVDPECLFT